MEGVPEGHEAEVRELHEDIKETKLRNAHDIENVRSRFLNFDII